MLLSAESYPDPEEGVGRRRKGEEEGVGRRKGEKEGGEGRRRKGEEEEGEGGCGIEKG